MIILDMADSMSGRDNEPVYSYDKQEQAVSISGEREQISKKLVTQEFVIEKRWVKKVVQVPMAYEEIFVNGKRFGSKNGIDSLLQSLSAIGKSKEEKERAKHDLKIKKHEDVKRNGEPIPLIEGEPQFEEILPLYAEKITVNRKVVKYAEAIIAKKKVSEIRKVKVQLRGEKVTILYPDGTERTLESTAPTSQMSETA